jgi:two-component system copper resistance phosphate regulon response regulator CusR
MKLLVVEDEAKTANFLKRGFSESGFLTEVAPDGAEALRLLQSRSFDLIVLILTARETVEDRVTGLELGADDYLVKPFAFAELLARVRTILRRPPLREPATLRVADLEVDLAAHRATRAGQRLDLTTREFALLSLLVRKAGEVLTRTMIAQSVWDMHFSGDTNVVDVSVRRLRCKLDDPFPRKLLRTVRGVGYVLETPE